eukprot:1158544-Pelagomonas_calceolata.AAC.5
MDTMSMKLQRVYKGWPTAKDSGASFAGDTCSSSVKKNERKRKSHASGSHLKRHIKEGPTPTE